MNEQLKEIVIISGKGGTGKTSITASYAHLEAQNAIIADCDVDAADLHLLLDPQETSTKDFYSGYTAVINPDSCTNCGICAKKCAFNAIHLIAQQHEVNPIDCEGCAYCEKICPENAILMKEQKTGNIFHAKTKNGSDMVHAKLAIGAENSGKLIAEVKKDAKNLAKQTGKNYLIIDGPPGIGCPVVSSLSGADYTLIVTEPSLSGLSDLKRVHQVTKIFKLPVGCLINKSDLNPGVKEQILSYLEENKIDFIAELPFNKNFTKAMIQGKTIVEYDHGEISKTIRNSWEKIKGRIDNKKN